MLTKITPHPIPAWVNILPLPPKRPEQFIDLLLHAAQIHVDFEETFYQIAYRINNEAAIQDNSKIAFRILPSSQQLLIHTLQIIRNGSVIDKLPSTSLCTASGKIDQFSIYATHEIQLILEDVRQHDIIFYSFTIKGFQEFLKQGFYTSFRINPLDNYEERYYRIVADNKHRIHFQSDAPDFKPVVEQSGKETSWTIRGSYFPESLTILEFSEYDSWSALSERLLELYPSPSADEIPQEMHDMIEGWKKQNKTKQELALDAVTFVQDKIRYQVMNLDSNGFAPYTIKKIFERRFGDCKDKAYLLKTFLSLLGIESHVVAVYTHKNHTADCLPNPALFDHVILQIKLDHLTRFVDPTLSQQGGQIDQLYCPDYGMGLILKKGQNALEPTAQDHAVQMIFDYQFTLEHGENGAARLDLIMFLEGYEADEYRLLYKRNTIDELDLQRQKYLEKRFGKNTVVDSHQIEDDRSINRMIVKASFEFPDLFRRSEKDSRLRLPMKPGLFDKICYREDFQHPLHCTETFHFIHPSLNWDYLDEHPKFENEYAAIHVDLKTDKKTLSLSYDYQTKSNIQAQDAEKHDQMLDRAWSNTHYSITLPSTNWKLSWKHYCSISAVIFLTIKIISHYLKN